MKKDNEKFVDIDTPEFSSRTRYVLIIEDDRLQRVPLTSDIETAFIIALLAAEEKVEELKQREPQLSVTSQGKRRSSREINDIRSSYTTEINRHKAKVDLAERLLQGNSLNVVKIISGPEYPFFHDFEVVTPDSDLDKAWLAYLKENDDMFAMDNLHYEDIRTYFKLRRLRSRNELSLEEFRKALNEQIVITDEDSVLIRHFNNINNSLSY